jgi:hypothetical protein
VAGHRVFRVEPQRLLMSEPGSDAHA